MFCVKCGNAMEEDQAFCTKCGAKNMRIAGAARRDAQPNEPQFDALSEPQIEQQPELQPEPQVEQQSESQPVSQPNLQSEPQPESQPDFQMDVEPAPIPSEPISAAETAVLPVEKFDTKTMKLPKTEPVQEPVPAVDPFEPSTTNVQQSQGFSSQNEPISQGYNNVAPAQSSAPSVNSFGQPVYAAPAASAGYNFDYQGDSVGNVAADQYNQEPEKPVKKKHSKAKIIIPIVIVLVLIACGAVGYKLYKDAEYEKNHTEHTISVALDLSTIDAGIVGVPIDLSGTDIDGNEVMRQLFLSDGSNELSLLPGDYTMTPTSYSFNENGSLFEVSGDAYQFTVSVDDSSSSNESSAENSANDSSSADTQGDTEGTTSEGDTPNFNVSTKEVPAVDITDDMINKAVEYISSNDEFADKVSGYKDAVVQKRDKAVAEKQAQEALNKKIESAKSAYDEVIAEYKKAQSDFKTSSTSDFMANKYKYVNSVFMYDDFGPECSYAYEDLDKDSIPELIVCSTDGGLVYGVFDYNPDNDTISSTNECAKYRYQFYYCGNGCFRTDASGGSECSDLKAYSYADGAVLNLVYELYYDGTDSSGKTYKVELYENGSTTNKTLSSQEMQNAISAMNAAYPVCKVNGTAIS